jgi:hypothetical protein
MGQINGDYLQLLPEIDHFMDGGVAFPSGIYKKSLLQARRHNVRQELI